MRRSCWLVSAPYDLSFIIGSAGVLFVPHAIHLVWVQVSYWAILKGLTWLAERGTDNDSHAAASQHRLCV